MNAADYVVIALYLTVMVSIGIALRGQASNTSFFLGNRSLGWFPLALSTMATQLSAISFISAPAFVGMRQGGGLKWLTYEFSVPLAMVLVMFLVAPALYRANVVSIYDYLETRLGRSTRILISVCFQIVRSFSTGIMIYAPALILQAVLDIPTWQSIVAVGVIALAYSSLGGMKAVVYSDAIQMILIFGGLIVVGVYAVAQVGGGAAVAHQVEAGRWLAVDFSSVGVAGDEFGFAPMLFGGFVLYASYYGCDQTQAQRFLSATDMPAARRLLLTNGILRFPLVLLYCLVGLVVGTAVRQSEASMARIPVDRPDFMMPIFIVDHLPHGIIGLLIVAILSAAMSSVSSGMNSLAAVTLEDLRGTRLRPRSPTEDVAWARGLSITWGVVIVGLSFFAGSIAPTVIEAINKVGSALYGPVLGVFVIAIAAPRRSAAAANIGLVTGLVLNLYFWLFVPQLFWMWWNFIGLVVTTVVALAVGALLPARPSDREPAAIDDSDSLARDPRNRRTALVLALYFVLIVLASTALGPLGLAVAQWGN